MSNDEIGTKSASSPIVHDWLNFLTLQHKMIEKSHSMCGTDPVAAAALLNISLEDATDFGSLASDLVAQLKDIGNWYLEFPDSLVQGRQKTDFFGFLIDKLSKAPGAQKLLSGEGGE